MTLNEILIHTATAALFVGVSREARRRKFAANVQVPLRLTQCHRTRDLPSARGGSLSFRNRRRSTTIIVQGLEIDLMVSSIPLVITLDSEEVLRTRDGLHCSIILSGAHSSSCLSFTSTSLRYCNIILDEKGQETLRGEPSSAPFGELLRPK